MPRQTARKAAASKLISRYVKSTLSHSQHLRDARARRRAMYRRFRGTYAHIPQHRNSPTSIGSFSSESSLSSLSSISMAAHSLFSEWGDEDSDSDTDEYSSDTSSSSDSSLSRHLFRITGSLDDPMPELQDLSDSESESDSSSSSGSGSSKLSDFDFMAAFGGPWLGVDGDDADDEGSSGSDGSWGDIEDGEIDMEMDLGTGTAFSSTLGRQVRSTLDSMYAHRYQAPRDPLPKAPSNLHHVLTVLKPDHPRLFRQQLRVTPFTFDRTLSQISDDPIFINNSNNDQIPVAHQLAIVLYRFGRFGNGAGLQDVANWAGIGQGTVSLVTKRVMTAVLRDSFVDVAVRLPTASEKQEAKRWVSKHSCHAWRNGCYFVDGTLVPLFDKPFWYGESYFDRKSNYSLNIQIVSLPNLRIVDFSFGRTGSTHDATAWQDTRFVREREEVLAPREFIWADSAYPISTWVVAPYKKPLRNIAENEDFNKQLSQLRIRSEHAIGFLKGRFQSLKGLRVRIKDEPSHKFATYQVAACVVLHAFAMQCEADERATDELSDDSFIAQGMGELSSDSGDEGPSQPTRQNGDLDPSLAAGKEWRERLKAAFFEARAEKTRRRQERRSRRRQ